MPFDALALRSLTQDTIRLLPETTSEAVRYGLP